MWTPTKESKLIGGHKVLVGGKDYSYNKDMSRAQLTKFVCCQHHVATLCQKRVPWPTKNPFLMMHSLFDQPLCKAHRRFSRIWFFLEEWFSVDNLAPMERSGV
jgi:hypothetical protein